jgi:hypothetical protein
MSDEINDTNVGRPDLGVLEGFRLVYWDRWRIWRNVVMIPWVNGIAKFDFVAAHESWYIHLL